VQGLKPIYSEGSNAPADALADARDLLAAEPDASIPEWLKKYPPLAADVRAQAETGDPRRCRRAVAVKVVFVDESGRGQGRLGELLMEQIADADATGALYPAAGMAGVQIDAQWDGAVTAAFWYSKECSFGIPPGKDVRWSVRILQPGENWDQHQPQPLRAGQRITGRSAGVAFFLGLFALAQGDESLGEWDAIEVVRYMVALATLPEAADHNVFDPLCTLGGDEKRKLEALDALPADAASHVVLIYPACYPGSVPSKHRGLAVATVADLDKALKELCAGATRPDSLPSSRRAKSYIGGSSEVQRLTESLRGSRLHVVSGPGGVGKTARVIEATEPLWKEGAFPGGRFWIDLYDERQTGRTPDVVAAEAIATTCGEKPAGRLGDLRAQTRRLLAAHPGLVLLEGAETVSEGDVGALLDLFPGPTTVIWMTRRQTDTDHAHLQNAVPHTVHALGPTEALDLLCLDARCNVQDLSATERTDWEEIAKATERLPLLLGWAGEALRPDRLTTAAEYLAELRADPLGEIADPYDRELRNAGLFLRCSLKRVGKTKEMPDLPVVAERLFAGLAAFHPSHGAPLSWWPLAAGLEVSQPEGRRRLVAARRALLGLGLVTAQVSPSAAKAGGETLHAVHALAAAVATDLWRKQAAVLRGSVLDALCKAATEILRTPLPQGWHRDATLIAGRTREAAHFGHWLQEIEVLASPDALTRPSSEKGGAPFDSSPAGILCSVWKDFLLNKNVIRLPLLTLKDTAWTAVCRYFKRMAAMHPESSDLHHKLAVSWENLGAVRRKRRDWSRAEEAFNNAMMLYERLAQAHPDVPDFQYGLAKCWEGVGAVLRSSQEWARAEEAFNTAMDISTNLAFSSPQVADYHFHRAVLLGNLGSARRNRRDLAGSEEAFTEAIRICKKLAADHPDAPDTLEFANELAISWNDLGDVCKTLHRWAGAEEAYKKAIAISKTLSETHPEVPDFAHTVAMSYANLGTVRKSRHDSTGAEDALQESIRICRGLAEAHPDIPEYRNELFVSLGDIGLVRMAVRNLAGAKEAIEEAVEISRKLVEELPEIPIVHHNLARTLTYLGWWNKARDDWESAQEIFSEAMKIRKKLVERHRNERGFQRKLAASWLDEGDLRSARHEWVEAEEAFSKAMAINEKLGEEHPSTPDYERDRAVSWVNIGKVRKARCDWADAEKAFNNALRIWTKLVAEYPETPDFQHHLAAALEEIAVVAENRGNVALAEQMLRESLRVCESLTSNWPAVQLFADMVAPAMLRLEQLLLRLERKDEANALASRRLERANRLAK
jgi:tetratricopeptide (TPR) repeat protein